MKLRKIIINGQIIYTLREEYNGKKTEDAHYKFLKLRDVKNQNNLACLFGI